MAYLNKSLLYEVSMCYVKYLTKAVFESQNSEYALKFFMLFCIPHASCFSLANETFNFFFQVVILRIFHIRSIWSYLNSGNAGLLFSMNVLQLWSLICLVVRLKKYVLLTKLYFKTCFTPLPLRQMMLNNVQAKEKKRSCDNLMKCPQMAGLNNFLTGFGCEADALTKYAASLRSAASLEDNRCCSNSNNRASCFYTLSPTYVAKIFMFPKRLF